MKIIVESMNSKEPAVSWVMDMLKFKGVRYKISTAKKVGKDVSYLTVFEKKGVE